MHAILLQQLFFFWSGFAMGLSTGSVTSILNTSLLSSSTGLIKDNLFCMYLITSGSNIYIFYKYIQDKYKLQII